MAQTNNTEEYDGTTWTDGNDMVTARMNHRVTGTQTAALASGGLGPVTSCQEYDGTSWAAGGDMTGSGKQQHYAFGTLTNTIAAAGRSAAAYDATAEQYNGSAWSAVDSTPAGRQIGASLGTAGTGLTAGGEPSGGGTTNITYKYSESLVARTVTDS
jgi:hypothetical protein